LAASPALAPAPARPVSALDTKWGRLLIPSLSDFFFLALMVWLFGVGMGWKALLLDGDTGWHIRIGEVILDQGSVPKVDPFSWSKAGAEWFAWEWMTDIQYAVLHRYWGIGGVAVYSGVIICASAWVLLRTVLGTGANLFVSLVLTLFYVGASSVHHHARPHVWTLLLFGVTVMILVRDRRSPDRVLWWMVPITALWTNLHGGFLAGIAAVGLTGVGAALEDWKDWRRSCRYLSAAAACLAASLLNPYGWKLHAHVAEYLRSDFIAKVVQEFQSPNFRGEQARQFELVLLIALACVGLLVVRRNFVEALWVLFFAHQSLTSARHIPLFVLIASPVIAAEATAVWNRTVAGAPRKSIRHILHELGLDAAAGFRRTTFWIVAGLVPAIAYTTAHMWPTDFDRPFPVAMFTAQQHRFEGGRVLTTDQWGDYLLYKKWPRQKVFIDGRSDFYGEALGKDYLALMNADQGWSAMVNRYGFDLMLLPVKWPLVSAVKLSPEWKPVADDGTAILFERRNLQPVSGKTKGRG
jgi:hypothetical protein